MKALVLTEYNRFECQDVPRPTIGLDPYSNTDVLVEVKACGICGSDVHGMDGSSGRRIPPIIMGHEAAGVVAEVGAHVADLEVGDRVTFDSTVYCGRCHFCRRGDVNLCDHRRVLGVSCEEFRCEGAFAEYVAVPRHIVYSLPEGLAFEHAAMVEPVSVAVHGVGRLPICLADTAVVIGSGMIGLLAVQVLRASGCGQIIAVDVKRSRLELARRLGADETILAVPPAARDVLLGRSVQTDVVAEVRRLTAGRIAGEGGADLAVECVGMPSTVATAIHSVRKGGSVSLVGNLTPQVELPLQAVVTRELTLYGSCASRGDYPACLRLIARGAIDVEALTSAVAPLADGPEWFERLRDGEEGLMKVILTP